MADAPAPPGLGFWAVLRTLLGAARLRAAGRRRHQREVMRKRAGALKFNVGGLAQLLIIILMAAMHVIAAVVVTQAVQTGARVEAVARGEQRLPVDAWFIDLVRRPDWTRITGQSHGIYRSRQDQAIYHEADQMAWLIGGSPEELAHTLRDVVVAHGADGLIDRRLIGGELRGIGWRGWPAMAGSLVLLWWSLTLIFHGEALDMEVHRRRHPLWEWLFSHPVPPAAVFLAEMMGPVAASPIFYSLPLFPGVLYGMVHGIGWGLAAAILAGVPIALSAAALGKALEISAMLRLAPRSRGAFFGLMGWLGYVGVVSFFIGMTSASRILSTLAPALAGFVQWRWWELGVFLGLGPDGSLHPVHGILACWAVAAMTGGAAIGVGVWSAQQGIAGATPDKLPANTAAAAEFSGNAVYRKEMLWFLRDRSAVLQAVLVPLSLAGFQLFNMRGLLAQAQTHWNYLCGVAILFGTYFIAVLGPKSLASEGQALWIALTWPQGLEPLLKAKAWLWSLISSALVAVVLGYAALLYPAEAWKVALVGAGWFLFGRSMAQKAVTLANVTFESGEAAGVSAGQRIGTQLGSFTFSIGVLTQQWDIAALGIIYSMVTAAAMWEAFRAHLPYLYDPWAEPLAPPPTLLQSMLAISALVELGAVGSGIALIFVPEVALGRAASYGVAAALAACGVWYFLRGRGVSLQSVFFWRKPDGGLPVGVVRGVLAGAACGVVLGVLGLQYQHLLAHVPAAAEMLQRRAEALAQAAWLKPGFFVLGVFITPWAEEFLFRGLLFRALDREWGGWRAVAASAALFAVYHPAWSWLPIAALGAANAMLFKRTGQLSTAILVHAIYNALVLG